MADVHLAGRRPKQRSKSSPHGVENVLIAIVAIYVAVFAVWPLARLFFEALLPGRDGEMLGVLLSQWRSLATQRALFNTIEASVLATLVSVVIGVAVAFLLTLTDLRGKAALTFLALLAAARSLADHRIGLDRIHRRVVADPCAASASRLAPGTTNPALLQVGHRAGDGHRALDARLPCGAGGAAQSAARSRRGGAPRRRPSVTSDALGDRAACDAGDPRRRGARLRHLDRQFRHSGACSAFPAATPCSPRLIYQRLQGFGPRVLGEVAALALMLAAPGRRSASCCVRWWCGADAFVPKARARRLSRSGSDAGGRWSTPRPVARADRALRFCRCSRCSRRRWRRRSACRLRFEQRHVGELPLRAVRSRTRRCGRSQQLPAGAVSPLF